LYYEKVSCILCDRPVTHQSPNVDPTRPATGAGRSDRFLSLPKGTWLGPLTSLLLSRTWYHISSLLLW